MKYNLLLLLAGLLTINESRAQADAGFTHDVQGKAVPWTHTDFKNKPENFSFAIVADRTNGHRVGVFRSAIEKINDLQPEFVLSVGDLIEGYTTDTVELRRQWNEFEGILKPLQMPFFRVPGNHDVSNEVQKELWAKQFGRDYYHFTYQNVLFLILNSTDGDGVPFSEQQLAYAEQTIQQNPNVRWTFVLMHHPVWNKREENGFHRVEKALANRKYTVIAGHTHRYMASVHNNSNYYVLATTGGSTRLRGAAFGETDHISWVTMTEEGPSLVNLELDGILKDDFSNEHTRKLATTLAEDAAFKPVVLLPAAGDAGEGKVYLNLRNNAELPLQLETRFFQHPSLHVLGTLDKVTLPQGAQQQQALSIRQLGNSGFAAGDTLHMQYSLKYVSDEKGLPHLSGTFNLPVKPTAPEVIDKSMPVFTSSKLVEIQHDFEGSKVVYTLDGSEPGADSNVYTKPFTIDRTTTVKAKVVTENGDAASLSETATFEKLAFMKSAKARKKGLAKGLKYTYYEGAFKKLPDFSSLTPITTGVLKSFDLDAIKQRANQFAVLIEGYVDVQEDDLYTFFLTSDDGAKLFIGEQLIVDNDGSHSARMRKGYAALKKGLHPVRIEYFEDFDGELIQLEYAGEGKIRKGVPFNDLYRSR
ncbi:3',5'-cyclic AMP phosphodiesterase CpdA [Pontibacter mucosus]|uniref:3',5'-cyclic AMP phosphodiesterase CpdA n=1 Tax=Pontibacter mucosus TaxID=1649266 RepID=A0A2T5YG10_9BACT|nr:PA14 domain-containing protein [Pontibacter mucosus]PTX18224.1 3',5'-cyclic AMP phosphodiesterase CpdA [Pontibacter mucosus]